MRFLDTVHTVGRRVEWQHGAWVAGLAAARAHGHKSGRQIAAFEFIEQCAFETMPMSKGRIQSITTSSGELEADHPTRSVRIFVDQGRVVVQGVVHGDHSRRARTYAG